MSAPIQHSAFSLNDYDPLAFTVTLWRGAMIDRYARAESAVFLCIRVLWATGAELTQDFYHDGAKARLRALASHLDGCDLTGAKAAARSLRKLLERVKGRAGLAHGLATPGAGWVEFEWVRPGKLGNFTFERQKLTLQQMLAELSGLDKLQRDIASQLGTVRKAALDRSRAA